ncbi:MAG: PTS sugar transporter subunit IIB [Erysipelotrichaceae bacterium]|nr:PTS sugar transporter subunit IIB [Erysipelotrichaceae bacterium]MBQ1303734.1 PTS sugar transporter subunit IIB [Erysipelotrichaceae bacterium]
MITQLRIDDRLFHGEIIVLWVPSLKVNSVVVADDEYASNQLNIVTAQLSKPKYVNLNILKIDDAVKYLQDPAHAREKILVTCRDAQNALNLCRLVPEIPEVNAACMRHAEGKKQIQKKVFVDQQDIADLKEIANMGKRVLQQSVPADAPMSLETMVKKAQ